MASDRLLPAVEIVSLRETGHLVQPVGRGSVGGPAYVQERRIIPAQPPESLAEQCAPDAPGAVIREGAHRLQLSDAAGGVQPEGAEGDDLAPLINHDQIQVRSINRFTGYLLQDLAGEPLPVPEDLPHAAGDLVEILLGDNGPHCESPGQPVVGYGGADVADAEDAVDPSAGEAVVT